MFLSSAVMVLGDNSNLTLPTYIAYFLRGIRVNHVHQHAWVREGALILCGYDAGFNFNQSEDSAAVPTRVPSRSIIWGS